MQDTSQNRLLSFPPRASSGDEALLGPSPAIARVWAQIRRVAPHFRAALITGEYGCGAEAAARALHALSPVGQLPFTVLDPATAERDSTTSGLIFLPAPASLSPHAQRTLVRKLRQRPRTLRIVAELSSDLRACVSAGRIQPELAEALGAVRIPLPPLRDRLADLHILAAHILQRSAERNATPVPSLTDSFYNAAAEFPWPGNVSQLVRVIDHLVAHTDPATPITGDHLLHATVAIGAALPTDTPARMVRLEEIVQEHIRSVLIGCHGNKLRAAEVLGISRSTLYRMLDNRSSPHDVYPMAM